MSTSICEEKKYYIFIYLKKKSSYSHPHHVVAPLDVGDVLLVDPVGEELVEDLEVLAERPLLELDRLGREGGPRPGGHRPVLPALLGDGGGGRVGGDRGRLGGRRLGNSPKEKIGMKKIKIFFFWQIFF